MIHPAFSLLPAQAQASLVQLSQAVHGVVPVDVREWEILAGELPLPPTKPQIVDQVAAWVGKSKLCLYYFECLSEDADLSEVERVFRETKGQEEKKRSYPRFNQQNICFYVGTSQTVTKRFSEHLGYGAAGTYAMQLTHWAPPLNLTLRFVCAKYDDKTPYSIVQALEDALWENKQPMFGRQGRR